MSSRECVRLERPLGFADEGLGGREALGGGEKQGVQAGRTMNKAPVVYCQEAGAS